MSEQPTEGDKIELEEPADDLEATMREALAAVEAAEGERAAAPPDPGNDVGALRQEIADLRDRSMRTLADFDNFRKRAERERQEVRRYALLEPLRDFLPIADNLERALSAGGSADDLKRGVEMILRQMQDLLRRFGVREITAAGEVFNPAVHEAVARAESDAVGVPTVTEALVRGYMLHDRLLRPAMVKVAVPSEKSPAATGATGAASPADPASTGGAAPPADDAEPRGH
jgi:molecular chaperone GrpE